MIRTLDSATTMTGGVSIENLLVLVVLNARTEPIVRAMLTRLPP